MKRLKNEIKKLRNKFLKPFKILKYRNYKKTCIKQNKVENIVFCTPTHGNIGDHAIILSIKKFMKDMDKDIFEFSTYEKDMFFDYIVKKIPETANVYITGGGFMGSQWFEEETFVREIIKAFPNNRIIVFPQTIFYAQDDKSILECKKSIDIYNNHNHLYICAREEGTYNFVKEKYKNVKLLEVPDIVLYYEQLKVSLERKNILICLRKDKEKNLDSDLDEFISKKSIELEIPVFYTDTVIDKNISYNKRERIFNNKLKEFLNAKLVITDRLHGMIFAYLTKTPCIVLGNYNYKVEGVYNKWIKDIEYIKFINNKEDIELAIKDLVNSNYDFNKKFDINKFMELSNVVKEIN